MTPHLVKEIQDPVSGQITLVAKESTNTIPLKSSNIETVINGMIDVTKIGTGRGVFAKFPYDVAG